MQIQKEFKLANENPQTISVHSDYYNFFLLAKMQRSKLGMIFFKIHMAYIT